MLYVPGVVGVPEMIPYVLSRVSPGGIEEPAAGAQCQVYGGTPPEAVSTKPGESWSRKLGPHVVIPGMEMHGVQT